MPDITETLHKIPPWGWIVVAGGIGVLLFFQNRSSAPAASSTATPTQTTLPGSVNTATPTGPCTQYSQLTCAAGDFVVYEQDAQGCPKPVCASTLGGGGTATPPPATNPPPAPACNSTLHYGRYTVGYNGPLTTLRQIYNAVGQDVNCALQWNPSGAYLGLDGTLWHGFVVYY